LLCGYWWTCLSSMLCGYWWTCLSSIFKLSLHWNDKYLPYENKYDYYYYHTTTAKNQYCFQFESHFPCLGLFLKRIDLICGTLFLRRFGMAVMVGTCGTLEILAFDRLDKLWFSFLSNCYLWFTCKIKLYNTIDVGYLELQLDINCIFIGWFWVMVFNTTFNNISVISWWSVYIVTIVLLVEETWVSRENNYNYCTSLSAIWCVMEHWKAILKAAVNIAFSAP